MAVQASDPEEEVKRLLIAEIIRRLSPLPKYPLVSGPTVLLLDRDPASNPVDTRVGSSECVFYRDTLGSLH